MLQSGDDRLGKICFSDESRVVLGRDNQWLWYRRREADPATYAPMTKFPPSVMVFAVIGSPCKSPLLITMNSIKADKYIHNYMELNFTYDLDDIHGRWNWIYDQDGAHCHRDRQALGCLEERGRVLQDWPPNTPGLSPIETYLAVLKRAVSMQKPTTVDTPKTALERAWDSKYRSIVPFMSSQAHHVLGQSISRDLWLLSDEQFLAELRARWRGRSPQWISRG
jgi:hypothetical protein